jgi:hypothetical protein
MSVKDLTLDSLKKEWNQLEQTVEQCFNVKDIIRFELLSKELEQRGYEIIYESHLRKRKNA